MNAAIFIDYANLYDVMHKRAPSGTDIHDVLLELIEDVCQNLTDRKQVLLKSIRAYADFSTYADEGAQVQHLLGSLGIEPCFVSNAVQANAVELRICTDAAESVFGRPSGAVVVLSGDHLYLPLLQFAKKHGQAAHLVLLDRTPESDQLPFLQDSFDDVSSLLSQEKRGLMGYNSSGRSASWGHRSNGSTTHAHEPEAAPSLQHLVDPLCITALEVIDEYFGQYDEIYLTPLLRKLSEVLEGENCDPKTLISDLEQAGAVWLEKRRGFPYDYTVLLVNRDHPEMQRILDEGPSLRPVEDDYRLSRSMDSRTFD